MCQRVCAQPATTLPLTRMFKMNVDSMWTPVDSLFWLPGSCPGDFCYYDETTNEQHCNHCCHAPHKHADQLGGPDMLTETFPYISDQRKVPCDQSHPGEMNGICDGFGICTCAPPFITDDCSVSK